MDIAYSAAALVLSCICALCIIYLLTLLVRVNSGKADSELRKSLGIDEREDSVRYDRKRKCFVTKKD